MSYFPVKAVSVFLWGRRVGVIAGMQDGKCAFEYDPAFRRSGLEISPIAMPLSKALYSSDEFEVPRRSLHGLPGVFADSLPGLDDWQNQHALSVNGKFSRIGDDDLSAVAEKYAIGTAPKVLARVRDAVRELR